MYLCYRHNNIVATQDNLTIVVYYREQQGSLKLNLIESFIYTIRVLLGFLRATLPRRNQIIMRSILSRRTILFCEIYT